MARLAAALLLAAAAAAVLAGPAEGLGVNWGTQASHPLPPKVVVQLLRDNGINKVKLFETNIDAMKALAGSGVEVMLAIPNNMLHHIAGDSGAARDWVKRNVKRFDFDGGVIIKYVAVGNEPFLEAYKGSFIKVTLPALENIQNALNDAGVGDRIKATVPLNADVYNSPARNPVPSAGRFRAEISGVMTDIVKFLAKNKAPFTVNIYPFLSLYLDDNFPLDFAFFDGGATPVNDNGVMYTNVYEANFDTLVAALAAVGHGDMPIIVGEVGWPTDGDRHAKASHARRFYDGLLRRLSATEPAHRDVPFRGGGRGPEERTCSRAASSGTGASSGTTGSPSSPWTSAGRAAGTRRWCRPRACSTCPGCGARSTPRPAGTTSASSSAPRSTTRAATRTARRWDTARRATAWTPWPTFPTPSTPTTRRRARRMRPATFRALRCPPRRIPPRPPATSPSR